MSARDWDPVWDTRTLLVWLRVGYPARAAAIGMGISPTTAGRWLRRLPEWPAIRAATKHRKGAPGRQRVRWARVFGCLPEQVPLMTRLRRRWEAAEAAYLLEVLVDAGVTPEGIPGASLGKRRERYWFMEMGRV